VESHRSHTRAASPGSERWPHVALALAVSFALAAPARAQRIPDRLADSTFWRMISTMSEPSGYFRSDNLVSNERQFLWVIPTLQRTVGEGGVYLGVAPDQNFTYIAALKPKIAIIVDIRRGAMLQHLMYKALFELSADRAEFLSRLFSRPRPAGLGADTKIDALFAAFDSVRADSALYRRTLAEMTQRLVATHGFTLGEQDVAGLEYVFNAFFEAGPNVTYSFGQARGGYGGGFRNMPSFAAIQQVTDSAGEQRTYLATESNYRFIKDFEERNLLVPLVGDFAGPKALRAVGDWLRAYHAAVSVIYTSNVEQYLFRDPPDAWRRYYENVATLPLAPNAQFIRSTSRRGMGRGPGPLAAQLLSPVDELLAAFRAGRITSYDDVIALSKP
jgi:hypothetical protein